ncbi:Zinc finger CCCH domain-containing protein 14 [Sarcoptes scabiei]|uniref:Zinc finger CCCH domain-containing protein 14 n=1 Tax=Sarcoptes scabiei TaxID=52283 RepID=A0A834V8H2_SARSC|nr:Zinc finger CCCH domain-containing protein 14 [Sarcoptes scabiei]
MVVNNKNKYEMKHNLALFLGKISDDFVNWLFEYLFELKSNDKSKTNFPENEDENPPEKQLNEIVQEKDSNSQKLSHSSDNRNNRFEERSDKASKKRKSTEIVSENSRENKKRLISVIEKEKSDHSDQNHLRDIANEQSADTNNENQIDKDSKKILNRSQRIVKLDSKKDLNPQHCETKFYVTLEGVDDLYKSKENDSLFLMDEDLDPELMNEDLSSISQFPLNKKDNSIKDSNSNKIEKCRYWPSCLNGHCEFYHPTIKCNLFPHCRFGEKCLYIHPICKFDSLCARKDCPFTHSNSKRVFINHTINSSNNIIICKYFPKCVNPGCEFLHPKVTQTLIQSLKIKLTRLFFFSYKRFVISVQHVRH